MSDVSGFHPTAISGVILHRPRQFFDGRGSFHEVWNLEHFAAAGIHAVFMQDNLAVSAKAGTVRGLHFQNAPMAQAKLVWVARGAVLDVALDLRPQSPTYGHHVTARLTAEGGEQLFIPKGFAHAYCTLTDDAVVAYKVDAPWSPQHEGGILWNDPALGIDWPVTPKEAIVAERDMHLPSLAAFHLDDA